MLCIRGCDLDTTRLKTSMSYVLPDNVYDMYELDEENCRYIVAPVTLIPIENVVSDHSLPKSKRYYVCNDMHIYQCLSAIHKGECETLTWSEYLRLDRELVKNGYVKASPLIF